MVVCVRERLSAVGSGVGSSEWLSALAVSCLWYGVVVCGSEWLSAVGSGRLR